MKTKLKKQPSWVERALQGVAYWMGHRRCLYRDYPLSEGALVAEVCNLIYANLPDTDFLNAALGLTLFPLGYLLHALTKRPA